MAYPELSEVRKSLRVDWYRCKTRPGLLREMSRRSDAQGWFQAGGHLALFIFTGSLVYYFWAQGLWLLMLLALFCHGTVTSFFRGIAPHELGHGTVFKTKWLNKAFLYLFSLIGWWDHYDYASSHTYHHRYTLHPEGDREVLLPLEPSLASKFMLQMFTINLLTPPNRSLSRGGLISSVILTTMCAFGRDPQSYNEWTKALHLDQPEEHHNSILWSRITLLFHGSILVAAIATGLWVLPFIFSLSVFIGNALGYFIGITQHCGLRDHATDFRKNTRSVKLNPLFDFLYWRMGWHIEHHMFAGVPCYNLEKLYKEVAHDMPEPRTLIGAWKEMRETWRRQKIDPDYQYDTPLPRTAKKVRDDAPEKQLEASIGELAPAGLQERS
ncbi:MAG: fatty acid desaturase [Chloroflexota bacterium]|nr:fatty acid desaturase [Chloroflexota bacterium]MDE2911270.1 fatty acid desaturase [Chloroflexota bacterium]